MKVLILENPDIVQTSDRAKQYLSKNSRFKIKFTDNQNIRSKIGRAYREGVRKFVLTLTSDEIIGISDTIIKLDDAMFVSPTSTLTDLRGKYRNLLFSSASNIYIEYIIMEISRFSFALVYENQQDPFVQEVINTFEAGGIATFASDDLGWQSFTNLILLSINSGIYVTVNSNVLPEMGYNLFGLELFPPEGLMFAPNILANNVLSPLSTGATQQDSFWNELTRNVNFNRNGTTYGAYPLLTNVNWETLEEAHLISCRFQNNGFYVSRDLRLNQIDVKFTRDNPNVRDANCYIWLIDPEYLTPIYQNNLAIIKKVNPRVEKFIVTADFARSVEKYWDLGFRSFILDGPSSQVKRVQNLQLGDNLSSSTCSEMEITESSSSELDLSGYSDPDLTDCSSFDVSDSGDSGKKGKFGGLFICTRSTEPSIRKSGSPYLFALANDNVMIQTEMKIVDIATNSRYLVIVGHSRNSNVRNFKAELDRLGIPHISLSELNQIPTDTAFIDILANDREYEFALDFIVRNKSDYPDLTAFRRFGEYITETQSNRLRDIGITGELTLPNYNSSQPFLESKYSRVSRPLYLVDYTQFLYLSNILLNIDPQLLFNFGYLVDV